MLLREPLNKYLSLQAIVQTGSLWAGIVDCNLSNLILHTLIVLSDEPLNSVSLTCSKTVMLPQVNINSNYSHP